MRLILKRASAALLGASFGLVVVTRHAGCASAPAAAAQPVSITAVVETACGICGPSLLEVLAKLHPGAKTTVLDFESEKGKGLIAAHQPRTLPLYLLDRSVERAGNFRELISTFYEKSQDSYLVQPGPHTFAPSVQLERPRAPGQLDIFMAGLSQNCVQPGLDLLRFLSENGDKVKDLAMSLHFVVQETVAQTGAAEAAGLTSDRGEAEIREDVRQICLFQHATAGEFFAYLQCRNEHAADKSRAEQCLQAGQRVNRCIESGEGLSFLHQDAQLVRELGIVQEPAFLWENRYGPFGWNEVDWRKLLLGSPKTAAVKAPEARAR